MAGDIVDFRVTFSIFVAPIEARTAEMFSESCSSLKESLPTDMWMIGA